MNPPVAIAHAFVARLYGDQTASELGWVSLNPLNHIDPFETILLPCLLLLTHSPFLFGYVKPVPVKLAALRNPRRDMAPVAVAGPTMNVGLAFIAALGFHLIRYLPLRATQWTALNLRNTLVINVLLVFFNLFPIPHLMASVLQWGSFRTPWRCRLSVCSLTE